MLRKLRIAAAVVCFTLVTLLFLDFTGTLHAWFGWLARIQFLPALLAVNVGVVAALVVATLLFGRVYCSVVCPLGVMQDIVSWISGLRKKKQYRFSYSPEKKWLRYGVLGVFIIVLVVGIGSFVALLAPYSSYGRIAAKKTIRIDDLLQVALHFFCCWQRTVNMDITNINQSAAVNLCNINISHLLKL